MGLVEPEAEEVEHVTVYHGVTGRRHPCNHRLWAAAALTQPLEETQGLQHAAVDAPASPLVCGLLDAVYAEEDAAESRPVLLGEPVVEEPIRLYPVPGAGQEVHYLHYQPRVQQGLAPVEEDHRVRVKPRNSLHELLGPVHGVRRRVLGREPTAAVPAAQVTGASCEHKPQHSPTALV